MEELRSHSHVALKFDDGRIGYALSSDVQQWIVAHVESLVRRVVTVVPFTPSNTADVEETLADAARAYWAGTPVALKP